MNAITLFHVVAGSFALAGGAGALAFPKGGRWHGRTGTLFLAAMLAMAGSGAVMAALTAEPGTALIGLFTCYLVATGWAAARTRDSAADRAMRIAMLVALTCCALQFALGAWATMLPRGRVDSLPAAVNFGFGTLALVALLSDRAWLRRPASTPAQRIARHLWRMGTALLIAALSFFLGQQDEFPKEWRGLWFWFAPPLLAMAAMFYWLARVRF